MQSDLAITVTVGAIALALIAALLWWVGRATSAETLSWEKKLGIWSKSTRASEDAFKAGHAAAAPFMRRYALICAVFAALTIVLAFVSDIAAVVVYALGLIFFALGVMVIRRKANSSR